MRWRFFFDNKTKLKNKRMSFFLTWRLSEKGGWLIRISLYVH